MSAATHHKSAPSNKKGKRKHTEQDSEVVPARRLSAEKPPKKIRSRSPARKLATQPSGKKGDTKAKKVKLLSKAKPKVPTIIQNCNEDQQQTTKSLGTSKPIPSRDESEGENPDTQIEEEEIHLQGFSSESDSSDEEPHTTDAPPLDISKLPTFPNDDASIQRKLEKAKRLPNGDKGVIYLGRIPHGFYEDQMKAYFSQFGDVSRIRLSRNKKTGRSKHYAFIEFDSSAVAEIVSETMDNYLLMGHIMRCKVIPKDRVHPELWLGANKKWRFVPRDRLARLKQNKPRTQEERDRAESRLVARQKNKQAKILALGINYDLQAAGYQQKSNT